MPALGGLSSGATIADPTATHLKYPADRADFPRMSPQQVDCQWCEKSRQDGRTACTGCGRELDPTQVVRIPRAASTAGATER